MEVERTKRPGLPGHPAPSAQSRSSAGLGMLSRLPKELMLHHVLPHAVDDRFLTGFCAASKATQQISVSMAELVGKEKFARMAREARATVGRTDATKPLSPPAFDIAVERAAERYVARLGARNLWRLALDCRQDKNFQGEEAAYRRIVSCCPSSWEARADLGTALVRQGRIQDAIESFSQAFVLMDAPAGVTQPTRICGWYCDYARANRALGRYKVAESVLRTGLLMCPAAPALHDDLGATLSAQDRPVDADASFCRAVELDPYCSLYRLNRSLNQLNTKQYELAEDNCSAASRLALSQGKPLTWLFFFAMGGALAGQGRNDAAETNFYQAIDLGPKQLMPRLHFSRHLRSQRRWPEAVGQLRAALGDHPTSYVAACDLASLFLCQNDLDGADTWYRKALALKSGDEVAGAGLRSVHVARLAAAQVPRGAPARPQNPPPT